MLNSKKPVLKIKYFDLKPCGDGSKFRVQCPICPDGCLLVRRHDKTLRLEADDVCILCGQRIRYLDIDLMRLKEENNSTR